MQGLFIWHILRYYLVSFLTIIMLKIVKVIALVSLLLCGVVIADSGPPKATVKLGKTFGYRNGDVISVRVAVSNLPPGYVFDEKSLPQKGARLNKSFEFYGSEILRNEIVLKLQIFRLADSVSEVALPLPKLVWKNGDKILKIVLPDAKILFGPISAANSLQILRSAAPPLIDSLRESGPFAMMLLGIIVAIFSLFIFIFNTVEKIHSPEIHPYILALAKLRKLKKQPKDTWTDGCFEIFHEALDMRFGKTMFSHDSDAKYLPEVSKRLLALSDTRLYRGEKSDLSDEAVMETTRDAILKMLWEES